MCTPSAGGGASGGANLLLGRLATLGQLHFGLVVCRCRVAAASKSRIHFASSEYLPSSELLFCHFLRIYNGNREGFDL